MMIYLTKEQIAKVDELAVNYGLSVLQMMENAGRNFARFTASLKPNKVIVLYGSGNNGGDGLVAARHLLIYGFDVEIIAASDRFNDNVKNQLNILRKMNVKEGTEIKAEKGDVIIDALLGYNINRNPGGKYAELIEQANRSREKKVKIISFDLPSGFDPDNKADYEPAIAADYTLTLAMPKIVLKDMKNVYLVNIGIPNELYNEMGITIENYFSDDDVAALTFLS